MSEAFDPYHKWLGIQPKDQPPHHYRLLGIEQFESDPDVIASAADQRMAHVRSFQAGRHEADCQRILNEIATARVCLLDSATREAYDAELHRRSKEKNTPVLRAAEPGPPPSLPVARSIPAVVATSPVPAPEQISSGGD